MKVTFEFDGNEKATLVLETQERQGAVQTADLIEKIDQALGDRSSQALRQSPE